MHRAALTIVAVGLFVALGGCTSAPDEATQPTITRATPQGTATASTAVSPSQSAATPPASPSPTPYPHLPIPAGTPRCHSSQLEVALLGAGAATGNVLNSFEMRNRSGAACWVYGYVGFQLLDSRGRPLPQTLTRSTDSFFGSSDPPTHILLLPATPPLHSRAAGHAFFSVATDDATCSGEYMTAIASLEIWPPDEYGAIIIPARGGDWNGGFISCGGLSVNPLQNQPGLRTG